MAGHIMFVLLTQVVSLVLSLQPTCDIRYDQTLQGLVADCSRRNLTSVPRDLPVKLVALNLQDNLFTEITSRTFTSYSDLKLLSLAKNAIEGIDKNAFYGLHQLVELNLRGSRYLDNGSYPRGLFDPIRNLTSLHLGGDARYGFTFSSYIFLPLLKLETLWLKDSWPSPEQGKDFSRLNRLTDLTVSMSESPLVKYTLKNDTFLYLESVPLHNLAIYCSIDLIDGCAFCPLKNLTYLRIHAGYRSIITLKGVTRSFYGFNNRHTTMNDIMLRHLQRKSTPDTDKVPDRQVIGYLPDMCVKRLDLSNNRLMAVKQDAFQDDDRLSKCIEYLDLSRNYLDGDVACFFKLSHMMNLKSIDLSQNANRAPPATYPEHKGMKRLHHKSINGLIIPLPPKLAYFNASSVGHLLSIRVDVNFSNGYNLQVFDISHNGVLKSTAKVFGLSNVSYLDIPGMNVQKSGLTNTDIFIGLETLIARDTVTFPNLLMSEDSIFFTLMIRLKQLDVSGSDLQVINDNTFSKLENVQILSLSQNRLNYMPKELLNMPSLTSLDLSFNSINTIQTQERKLLDVKWQKKGKFSLNLFGNSFACTCATLDSVQWLYEIRIDLGNKGNYSCLTEFGTMAYTTMFFNDLLLHWRRCVGQFWLAVAVSLQLLIIICLMSAFLLKKYFPKVEYQILQWLELLEPKRWDYAYDAYVCYADKDYKWPCHCLFKELLQRDETMQLYLPDLHDPFGDVKAEVIHVAIENSWKLIVVVTEDLFTDEWSHFKVLEALRLFCQKGLITNRILLLYRDISTEAKAKIPEVLLKVVPRKNILHVKPMGDFWNELYQMVIREDINIDIFF